MKEFLEGWKDPSQVYSNTNSPLLFKAKQLQKFLILLFYTSLPPSRGMEIRTLQQGTTLQFRSSTNTWWLILDQFKTKKNKGIDSIELNPQTQDILITYLELFISKYRQLLLESWWKKEKETNLMITKTQAMKDDGYLFVASSNCKEQCYTESAWSIMMCQIFKEKTGMNVTINILRSAFITYFYGSEDSQNLNLRESVASGMRHSIQEAQRTYDRRYFPLSFGFCLFFCSSLFKYKNQSRKKEKSCRLVRE